MDGSPATISSRTSPATAAAGVRHARTGCPLLPRQPPAAAPADALRPPAGDPAREERVRLSRRRQTIAPRLVEAQQTAAMLTTFNEVDLIG